MPAPRPNLAGKPGADGGSQAVLENRPRTAPLVIDVQNGVVGKAYERDRVVANIQAMVDRARAADVSCGTNAIRSDSGLVRELTGSPDLDDWAIVERLLADLAPLQNRLWLVLDDIHELRSEEARRQVELLVLRAPPQLRIVLATRHDVRLGLHRLRLESELTEIRADDLWLSLQEALELFQAAGVELSATALATLHERAEGWADGLRMAALSLAGHPDPGRFAAEFSGTERTVAEYLLAEVLARQPTEVRELLLCSSGLDRVSGELADLLTGTFGGERMLQDLEEANAFVVSLDTARSAGLWACEQSSAVRESARCS
jgi:LuxR family maltose regulon positive regulatory protein